MRVVQPAVAKRITFSTWARKAGIRRHSNVSYFVPEEVDIPASLLAGAQIDGKPYEPEKPKTQRRRKTTRGPLLEPAAPRTPEEVVEPDPLEVTGEQAVFDPDDEPTGGTTDAMS